MKKMKPENKTSLSPLEKTYLFFYCILAFCSVIMLFRPKCDHDYTGVAYSQEQTQSLVEKVNRQQQHYEHEITFLQKNNMVLKRQLSDSQKQLSIIDAEKKYLSKKIYSLVYTDSYDTIENHPNGWGCDSLMQVSIDYVLQSEQRDSLCDKERFLLTALVENRDSAFIICDTTLRNLSSSFDLLAERHTQLAEQFLQTQKTIKTKKRREKLLSGAVVLLSGMTITLWIQKQ
ncbi:MAG: hypothetical protein ACOZCO_10540 [Bacteroidota bacterium]